MRTLDKALFLKSKPWLTSTSFKHPSCSKSGNSFKLLKCYEKLEQRKPLSESEVLTFGLVLKKFSNLRNLDKIEQQLGRLNFDVLYRTRIEFFKKLDPLNFLHEDEVITDLSVIQNQTPSDEELNRVIEKLSDSNWFNESMLLSRERDAELNAIVSLLLTWTKDSMHELMLKLSSPFLFLESLAVLWNNPHPQPGELRVFVHEGIFFVKNCIVLVKQHFRPKVVDANQEFFKIKLKPGILEQLYQLETVVTTQLRNSGDDNFVNLDYFNQFQGQDQEPGVELTNFWINDVECQKVKKTPFLTGTACCGKTTLLQGLAKQGWESVSRSNLGCFGAKTECPGQVGGMHSAFSVMDEVSLIGDRGPSDNMLWLYMMPHTDLRKWLTATESNPHPITDDFLKFLETRCSEASLAGMIMTKGVVILDPFFWGNNEKMLKRSEGGDSHRGRMKAYPASQLYAYGAAAILAGWKIFSVPYSRNSNSVLSTDWNLFETQVVSKVVEYFGKPKISRVFNVDERQPLAKVGPYSALDQNFSKDNCLWR